MSSSPSRHYPLFAWEVCAVFQATRVELRPEEFGSVDRFPRVLARTVTSKDKIFKAVSRGRKQDCALSASMPHLAAGGSGLGAGWPRPQAEESCRV